MQQQQWIRATRARAQFTAHGSSSHPRGVLGTPSVARRTRVIELVRSSAALARCSACCARPFSSAYWRAFYLASQALLYPSPCRFECSADVGVEYNYSFSLLHLPGPFRSRTVVHCVRFPKGLSLLPMMSAARLRRLRLKACHMARIMSIKRAFSPHALLRRHILHAVVLIFLSLFSWRSMSTRILGLHTGLDSVHTPPFAHANQAISHFRSHHTQFANFPNSLYIDDVANFHSLVTLCRIPPFFVSRLGVEGRRRLLIRLSTHSDTIPSYHNLAKLLIIDVQNGLGNRLRALASALEFSYLTRRVLVVVWNPDAHLNASLHHLFDESVLQNLILIQSPVPWPINANDVHPPFSSAMTANETVNSYLSSVTYFNFMTKDSESKLSPLTSIPNSRHKHLYIRTAYILRSKHAPGIYINPFVQALMPAPRVRELVNKAQHAAGGENALHTMIGVHIRSRTLAQDNEKVDHQCEYSVQGAEITNQWRLRSSPNNFVYAMKKMRRDWHKVVERSQLLSFRRRDVTYGRAKFLVDAGHVPRFFVSVDSKSALRELYKHFPRDHVITLPRNCDDRDAECVQYAFADMILLSRTGAMLASGWSSFSEAAQRLRVRPDGVAPWSNDDYVVRTSGVDFGLPWLEKMRTRIVRWLWGARKDEENRVSEKERLRICRQKRVGHGARDTARVGTKKQSVR